MNKTKKTALILLFFYVLILVLAASCRSPQRRHACLVNHYGVELCSTDTVVIRDTIIKQIKVPVPEYRDSFIFKHDTTYETKRVVVYKKGDRIFLRVKPDTIQLRDTIPFEVKVPSPVITKEHFNWWYLVVSCLIGMILAYRFRN
jgi:hypothetical protein